MHELYNKRFSCSNSSNEIPFTKSISLKAWPTVFGFNRCFFEVDISAVLSIELLKLLKPCGVTFNVIMTGTSFDHVPALIQ